MPPLGQLSKTALAVALGQTIAFPGSGAILTVNDLADINTPADGKCTLREAIKAVNESTADIDCGPDIPGNNDQIIFLEPGITTQDDIVLTEPEALFVSKDVSILAPYSATIDKLTVVQTAAFGVFDIIAGSTVTITNLGISGGSGSFGAGIRVDETSSLTLNESRVDGNDATPNHGGGIGVTGNSTVTLNDSQVTNNIAPIGAGMIATNGLININRSTIACGGLAALQSTVSISAGADIYGNYASGNGGGIDASNNSVVSINQSLVDNNLAYGSGAGISLKNSGTVTLTGSAMYANESRNYGGGIYVSSALARVSNSTISGNLTGIRGGGIQANNGGRVTLTNTTITNNEAGVSSGGIEIFVNSSAGIRNSLIAGNSSVGVANEVYVDGSATMSISGVNLFGRLADTSNQAFNNLFSPAAPHIVATSNGNQPTALSRIIAPITYQGASTSHALVAGSPAIGKARTSLCPRKDQRGNIREQAFFVPIVGTDNKIAVVDMGGECDIGATEFSKGDPPSTLR